MSRHLVISDLHLGMGRCADGSWHPLEDFKSDEAFHRFLDQADNEGCDELVINGDWIDFPQLEPLPEYDTPLYSLAGHRLCWTESESLSKFDSCIAAAAHKSFFDDLRCFLASGRKVTVLMGNHDPDLFWPRMRDTLRDTLAPSSSESLQIVATHTRRGSAHIEHGHQQCSPENAFREPLDIFHVCEHDGRRRLEMVWGTFLVCSFFNRIEHEYPFADNLKPLVATIWLGIRRGWIGGAEAAQFVMFMHGAWMPWRAISEHVLASRTPLEMIQTVDDAEIASVLLQRYETDIDFRDGFNRELGKSTRQELASMGDGRYEVPLRLSDIEPAIDHSTLGLFRDTAERRAARRILGLPDVGHVVFGHTHAPVDGNLGSGVVPNHFNSGTWTNSLDLTDPTVRQRVDLLDRDDLKDDSLFALRLTYVEIDVDSAGRTVVNLRDFDE